MGRIDIACVQRTIALIAVRVAASIPKPAGLYRAKTKGKVERPFRYIREDFFLARSLRNLEDLNAQLRHWLDTVANSRIHATTRRVVNEASMSARGCRRHATIAHVTLGRQSEVPQIAHDDALAGAKGLMNF